VLTGAGHAPRTRFTPKGLERVAEIRNQIGKKTPFSVYETGR